MTLLNKDTLRKRSADYRYHLVELPGGDTARIRNMRESDYAEFIDSFSTKKGDPIPWRVKNFRSLLIARCWVDEAGDLILTEDDIKAEWWKSQDSMPITAFFRACREWVGFDEADIDAREAAAKNLDETPADSSSGE